jgi:transcriptional regulator with XRE-family HTH domain
MKNRIRALRNQFKISQVSLSGELGVSQETISAYEKGKYFPSFENLVKLSEIFNASIDYIMGLSDIRRAATQDLLNEDQIEIVGFFNRLNTMNKVKAIAYVQGLMDSNNDPD